MLLWNIRENIQHSCYVSVIMLKSITFSSYLYILKKIIIIFAILFQHFLKGKELFPLFSRACLKHWILKAQKPRQKNFNLEKSYLSLWKLEFVVICIYVIQIVSIAYISNSMFIIEKFQLWAKSESSIPNVFIGKLF